MTWAGVGRFAVVFGLIWLARINGAVYHDLHGRAAQGAEGAKRHRATEPVERNVHTGAGQLAHPGHEILVAVVDRHRAEPLNRGAVAS